MRHTEFASTSRGLNRDSFPMKLWEKAKKLGIWNPADIDFTKDAEDWKKLDEEEMPADDDIEDYMSDEATYWGETPELDSTWQSYTQQDYTEVYNQEYLTDVSTPQSLTDVNYTEFYWEEGS